MRHFLTRTAAVLAVLAAGVLPARAEPPVTTFTLDNGMEVVVIEDHRAPTVTHMVWYRVGAADEPWGKSGIAHFFEHLMFKGTDDLAPGEFSQILAENGGRGNAFTSYDYTAYYQRVARDRLGLMMELEAERMKDLILNEEVVATEREVILEERNSRTDNNPENLFSEQMRGALYMNHPYGVPVIGWRHEIEALNVEDAVAFYERYYAPDNAILVVAGDVTPDEVRTLAEEHYGPLEPSGNPAGPRPQEPPHLAEQRLEMSDPAVRKPYMLRFYLVPNYNRDDPAETAAIDVLSNVLGQGITSMLSERVQVEEGKAIQIGAWYSGTRVDDATFGVWAVPKPGVSLEDLEAAVDEVIEEVKTEGPDPALLEQVKRNIRADEVYGQDDQQGLAQLYGQALAVGLTVEIVQGWTDMIDAVTVEDVQEAARKWLVPERSATGWLTAPEDEPEAPEAAGEEAGDEVVDEKEAG